MQFTNRRFADLWQTNIDVARWFWDSLIDRLCTCHKHRSGTLFVKLDAIGDFVLFYGFLDQYKATYQQESLYIVCSHELAGLAQATNLFTQVIPVKRRTFERNLLYRASVLLKIRKLGARRAIQANVNRRFVWGDAITLRSGADEKIAHAGTLSYSGWRLRWADKLYSRLVPHNESWCHELEYNRDLLKYSGLPDVEAKVARLPKLQQEMPDGLRFGSRYFVIFPGAGSPERRWPVERFAQLGAYFAERYGWKMLICGAPAEYTLGQNLLGLADCDGINLCGQSNLPEFCELVRGAEVLIGNDSGAVHVAAAVGTLSFCLVGGGHFNRFLPYPESVIGAHPIVIYKEMACYFCDWICTHEEANLSPSFPCIQNISVVNALRVIESSLSAN